jgi:hypothetical protein
MDEGLFDELLGLLESRGVVVRVEPLQHPSDSAGGLCRFLGQSTVILDSTASRSEQYRALLEAIEQLGLEALGLRGADLSPPLLRQLTRRGHMPWPHPRDAPKLARTTDRASETNKPESAPALSPRSPRGGPGRR